MALYRASPSDGVAWVTGASTGIGRELAIRLARAGYVVAATARDEDNLVTLVGECVGADGRIVPYPCDVTDEAAMETIVASIEKELGPLVLAVFNAGTYSPTRGQRLEALNFQRAMEVNVMGVIYGLVPAIDHIRSRRRGQIVFVGSISAYFGWPATAAYSASKAALHSIAESLKYDFDTMNIRIQIMNPGFVATTMTKHAKGLPAVMEVSAAADRMEAAIRTGGFETTFPRRFTWPMKALRILPQPLRFWFVSRTTGQKKKPRRK